MIWVYILVPIIGLIVAGLCWLAGENSGWKRAIGYTHEEQIRNRDLTPAEAFEKAADEGLAKVSNFKIPITSPPDDEKHS